ncbi:MAG: SRPBCC family protein [Bacteroidota bacterium]
MKTTTLSFSVVLDAPIHTVFEFHRDFKNVLLVSPPGMKIRIVNAPPVLETGSEFTVQLNVAGFWISWDVKVETLIPDVLLVDVQTNRGPFSYWKHEHQLVEDSGRTVLTDTITYELPFGIFGRAFNSLLMKSFHNAVFKYRHKKMRELFSKS